jgi:phage-related minor tail protein
MFPKEWIEGSTWVGKQVQKMMPQSLLDILTAAGGSKVDVDMTNPANVKKAMKQGGGSIVAGEPYLVGEAGPELILPSGSGQVIPNMRTQQMIQASIQKSIDQITSGGGGGGVSNSGNTSVVDSHTETTMVNTGVAVRRPIILGKA